VEISVGDLLHTAADAIVSPTNDLLQRRHGAAAAIAKAAGPTLDRECEEFIAKNRTLPTTQAMHTTAGSLGNGVKYVIHVAGPRSNDYRDTNSLQKAVMATFENCLNYANNTLQIETLCAPVICAGGLLYKWQTVQLVHALTKQATNETVFPSLAVLRLASKSKNQRT
jgi:O-acetyl-ADP-ribose deacetylase (regulator of RNase III)